MNIVNFCQTLSLKMFCVKIRDMKWVCPPPTPRAPRSDVFVQTFYFTSDMLLLAVKTHHYNVSV